MFLPHQFFAATCSCYVASFSLLFYYLHGPRAFLTGPLGCQPHVDEQFQEADQQLMLIVCSLHIGGNVSQRVDNWLGHLSVRNKSSSVSF